MRDVLKEIFIFLILSSENPYLDTMRLESFVFRESFIGIPIWENASSKDIYAKSITWVSINISPFFPPDKNRKRNTPLLQWERAK